MQQQLVYNMEVRGSLMIIKWEEFPAFQSIGLLSSTDFNRLSVSNNQFQNLSRFPAIIIMQDDTLCVYMYCQS